MIVATLDGVLARAQRGKTANCPGCGGAVYGREPEDAIRHWAHTPLPDGQVRVCDADRAMTEWHRVWQSRRTDLACIEVYRGEHRADAINAAGHVIEFQHSSISEADVRDREAFWRVGAWVLDGTGLNEPDNTPRVVVTRRPDLPADDPWVRFQWRRHPLLLNRAKWPCWIDLGNGRGLIQVSNLDGSGGNGWRASTEWFVDNVLNGSKLLLRAHKVEPKSGGTRTRQRGKAREERPEDLTDLVRECDRAAPSAYVAVGACCGNRFVPNPDDYERPVVGADPTELVPSCQLCSHSPTYWRRVRGGVS